MMQLLLATLFWLWPLHAYEQMPTFEPDPHEGLSTFNGMTLKQFGDFTKWQLVTVRFRRDSGEMRFTYANASAWKSLQSGTKTYPDGAIFAKIGIKTSEDPAFTSSVVPEGAARFQFMVKNRERFKDTDGWGYAIFDDRGKTLAGDPKSTIIACHACHRLVPKNDFVFSKPINLSKLVLSGQKNKTASLQTNNLEWHLIKRTELPAELADSLPKNFNEIYAVTGSLQKNLFTGTLDEIKPSLIRHASETGLPALLSSEDQLTYSLIYPDSKVKSACKAGQLQFVHLLKTPNASSGPRIKVICQ